jgi:hypothetical protein
MTETDLITAEDIVEDLEESGFSPMTWGVGKDSPAAHEWRARMLTTVRDIQRNVAQHWLERAAEAVEDIVIVENRVTIQAAKLTRHSCADAIRKLIPKDPAPAGEVKP